MSENLPERTHKGAVGALADMASAAVTYSVILTKLAAAGVALRLVGDRVRSTYRYVDDCAKTVDHHADLAAALHVDPDTLEEHRQAAQTMRSALAHAERMASTTDAMSTTFDQAKAAHETDYGPVAQAAQSMSVPMADRGFYANR